MIGMNSIEFKVPDSDFDTKKFMRWAMLTPVVLPLLIIAVNFVLKGYPEFRYTAVYQLGAFLLTAAAFSIVPYLVFAALSWNHIGKLSRQKTVNFIAITPFIFFFFELVFLLIAMLAESLMSGGGNISTSFSFAFSVSVFVLPVGYGYVILVLAVYKLVRWFSNRLIEATAKTKTKTTQVGDKSTGDTL